jgi:hypothetical protein
MELADYFVVVGVDMVGAEPAVIDRFPTEDGAEYELPLKLPLFVFPSGLYLTHFAVAPEPKFCTFVLTRASGYSTYVSCLVFYERWDPDGSGDEHLPFLPKALCLLSRWPFYNGFEGFLRALLAHSQQCLPVESLVARFMQISFPVGPISDPIEYQLALEGTTLRFTIPAAMKDFPLCDANFHAIFERLDLENILTLFSLVLLEQKVR